MSQHQKNPQKQQPAYFCTSWGLASKGQLGYAYHSIKSINASQVTQLDKNENFLDVACGENHTLLLTDTLEIVSCGSNTYGQLGIGNDQKQQSAQVFKVSAPQTV